MEQSEIRAAVEAILFASADPVSINDIKKTLSDVSGEEVDAAIEEIEKRTDEALGGIRLERIAGGLRFATRPELDPYLRKFFERKRENRLSMAALETLAIVAYRQPVTAPEVSELRSVNSGGVLKTLLDKKLIRISGRKNVVGSPFLYRTTNEFLMHFGLERVQDLPSLEEFGELVGESLDEGGLLEDLDSKAEQEVAAEEQRIEEREAEELESLEEGSGDGAGESSVMEPEYVSEEEGDG